MTDQSDLKRKALTRTTLFGSLSEGDLDQLVGMATLRKFSARQPLFMKGDAGDKLFIVISGLVRISTVSPDGRETTLNLIRAGQMFGEVAVLDGGERTADATAASDVEVLTIDRRDLLTYLAHNPRSSQCMLAACCERIRWVSELLEDAQYLDLPPRLAKRLLLLARAFGQQSDGGLRIGIRLSQQDLADHMNVSRESINKLLGQWRDEGLITIGRSAITVVDLPAFEALVVG